MAQALQADVVGGLAECRRKWEHSECSRGWSFPSIKMYLFGKYNTMYLNNSKKLM